MSVHEAEKQPLPPKNVTPPRIRYPLTAEECDRIDILKFIAIIFVVYIHSYSESVNFAGGTITMEKPLWMEITEFTLSTFIGSCAVPLFFLISSLLLFRKNRVYLPTLRRKARTLLFPYVFWNTLWIGVFFLLQTMPFTAPYFSGSYDRVRDFGLRQWLDVYGITTRFPHDYPLWFVKDLLVTVPFFPVMRFLADRKPRITAAAALAVLLSPVEFHFKEAVCCMLLGACLVSMNLRITAMDKISLLWWTVLYALFWAADLWLYLRKADLFLFPQAVMGIGILYWTRVTKAVYDRPALHKLFLRASKWTFLIYVAHELTISCFRKVCYRVLPLTPGTLLAEYLLLPLLVIAMCMALGVILDRISPRFLSAITGGRIR